MYDDYDEFDEFWLRHREGLANYLRAMPYQFLPEEIHDAVHMAFDWLKPRWSPDDDEEDVLRRVKCVARGRALDMLRRRLKERRIERLYLAAQRGVGADGADAKVIAADQHNRVKKAWLGLGKKDRDLITAHYVDRKSYKTISAETGLSETALRQQVSRSLARLRATVATISGLLVAVWTRITKKAMPTAIAAVPVVAHTVLFAIAVTSLVVDPLPAGIASSFSSRSSDFALEPDHHPMRLVGADMPSTAGVRAGFANEGTRAASSGLLDVSLPRSVPKPTVPKKVEAPCLTKDCKAKGDAIVITVAPGYEKEVSEPYVEMCEHMPVPTKPGDPVYCRNG